MGCCMWLANSKRESKYFVALVGPARSAFVLLPVVYFSFLAISHPNGVTSGLRDLARGFEILVIPLGLACLRFSNLTHLYTFLLVCTGSFRLLTITAPATLPAYIARLGGEGLANEIRFWLLLVFLGYVLLVLNEIQIRLTQPKGDDSDRLR